MLIAILSMPTIVYADDPDPPPNQGKCITCHEDLYLLHDTGNWFCLREAPMSCVDCHGGNPLATTQELAHVDRAAHPVINEDISKCQECHPEECTERVQIFDQTAGISEVMVAMPYTPKATAKISSEIPVESREDQNAWLNIWEILSILLLASTALGAYILHKRRVRTRK
ncbi:MAG TPA: hypothetical protein DGG95_05585 [Cytophagales bacterium]|nr:hypothetical protein [Cytophagales bacterium]